MRKDLLKKFSGLLVAVLLVSLTGCNIDFGNWGLNTSSSSVSADMPDGVSVDAPNNMKMKNDMKMKAEATTNIGDTYKQLQFVVTMGVNITEAIDALIGVVRNNYAFFSAQKGTVIPSGAAWFLYNTDEALGQFLYYGDSASTTNIYIDWKKNGDGNYEGKAVFYNNTATDQTKVVLVKYGYESGKKFMDVTFKPNEGVAEFSKLRVKLVQADNSAVKVFAKFVSTNTAVNYPGIWKIYGYGSDTIGGAIIAEAVGQFNTLAGIPLGGTYEVNIKYSEHFTSIGETIQRKGEVSMTDPIVTNVVFDDYGLENSVTEYDTLNNMTNDAAMEIMTNDGYTEPSLP